MDGLALCFAARYLCQSSQHEMKSSRRKMAVSRKRSTWLKRRLSKRKLQQVAILLVVVCTLTSSKPRNIWSFPRFSKSLWTLPCTYKIINYLPAAVITTNHPLRSIAPRSDEWWSEIVLRTFTERDCIEIFRMRKEMFTY